MYLKSLALALVLFFVGASAYADKVDELIEKVNKAQGVSKMKEIKNLKVEGSMNQMGMEIKFNFLFKNPDKYRSESEVMGQKMLMTYNGKEGWMINPMAGSTDPMPLPPEGLEQLKSQHDQMIGGAFDGYKEKGTKIKIQGKETIDGKDCYKLFVTDKDSSESTVYIDSKDYLIYKITSKTNIQGTPTNIEIFMKDYKSVNGVLFAHTIEQSASGMAITIKITSVDMETVIPDEQFEKPVKG